jgi:hypothetical protein
MYVGGVRMKSYAKTVAQGYRPYRYTVSLRSVVKPKTDAREPPLTLYTPDRWMWLITI